MLEYTYTGVWPAELDSSTLRKARLQHLRESEHSHLALIAFEAFAFTDRGYAYRKQREKQPATHLRRRDEAYGVHAEHRLREMPKNQAQRLENLRNADAQNEVERQPFEAGRDQRQVYDKKETAEEIEECQCYHSRSQVLAQLLVVGEVRLEFKVSSHNREIVILRSRNHRFIIAK